MRYMFDYVVRLLFFVKLEENTFKISIFSLIEEENNIHDFTT